MTREPPIIDMRPDGTFQEPPRRPAVPLQAKLMLGAVIVTAVGVSIAVAAVAIWVVSMLLPVIVLSAAVAYGLYKFQRWQLLRRHQGTPGSIWQNRGQSGRFR
jgi:predicted RND superfamily exporter protein